MADPRKLVQNRANIKGQMTRINNSINETTSFSEAKVKSKKIENLLESFEEIQGKIDECKLDKAGDEEAAIEAVFLEQEAERQLFEKIYFEAATKVQAIIDAAEQAHNEAQIQAARAAAQAAAQEGKDERRLDVKLPILKLPEFDGNYQTWLLFKDAFVSMIHDNKALSAIQKFQYLRGSLTGEALQVIGGLATTAANYKDAWELLELNYENKKLLINTHLNQLLDFPSLSRDKPATMRQLVVHVRTHLKALQTLELPVDKWDELLIHLLKSKIDFNAQKSWEEETNKDKEKRPTLEQFLNFLSERCRTLEMIDKTKGKPDAAKTPTQKKPEKKIALTSTSQEGCIICGKDHQIYRCSDFLQLSAEDRLKEVKAKKVCINCLNKGHFAAACKSSACKKCQRKHNTLLHLEQGEKSTNERKTNEESAKKSVVMCNARDAVTENTEKQSSVVNFARKPTSRVILSTARVTVEDIDGNQQSCRVLLDPGSQSNLITEELVKRLKLKCKKQNELISGINKSETNVGRMAEVKLRSLHSDYEVTIDCLVLQTITERLPQVKINTKLLCLPEGLRLADPDFHIPGSIDLLVGAGLFWQLICRDSIQQQKGIPRLQNTLLGWIVGGELIDTKSEPPRNFCGLVTYAALQAQVERFWTQEEVREDRRFTKEEVDCERQFMESFRRDSCGRFIVALPTRPEVELGESENQATKRLYSIERRFRNDRDLKDAYVQFMEDYERQQHMSRVSSSSSLTPGRAYILPHQPVIRPDSTTTKLRVVFDASAKTTRGTALNDKLMSGPNLQKDLFDIILRFRSHRFVITADIAAMFRQILVREEDRDLQRILWRSKQSDPIQIYRLNTVTYGTAPAPYLAMRCLKQLADEDKEFPKAAAALRADFYMDDVLTGANTVKEAKALQNQLSQLLQRGQFQLRKWRSNDRRILEDLSSANEVNSLLKIDKEGAMKTLGLLWDSHTDTMQYNVTIEKSPKITKRVVLSKIAQIFDPLGLLGPVVITAKCIMQSMWQLKTGWDEVLPPELQATWIEYYNSLPQINDIRIQRNVVQGNGEFDLAGFGDASERAYGACLYVISRNSKGAKEAHLICSKSRVAPLKTVSLPRLELNAALLLAKLCNTAKNAFGSRIRNVHLWSDSTVALSWIAESPHIRKTYVANRVSKIQELSHGVKWRHVPSKENPADLLSRGTTVEAWKDDQLWWHGPGWLTTDHWPKMIEIGIDTSEMKTSTFTVTKVARYEILRRFSEYEKLQRIVAYWLRFKNNSFGAKRSGPLAPEELSQADTSIARMTQREEFLLEIKALEKGQQMPKGSRLTPLNPFLDKEGIMRVGGRLSRADIPETQKHPIVLPTKHHITTIILRKEHIRLHHCGPEQLLYSIRQNYWPLSGRREARKITKNCLKCFRNRPTTPEVFMGDLPGDRVRGAMRPFSKTGVDYAGPLQVRESRRRGRIHIAKSWVAVFTCFATKAIHLELVTELTTESFLAALRRFTARRGICVRIVSDNGTNFVGASRELAEIYQFLQQEQQTITDHLARQKIEWTFIPPRAPHFGGLWEAAVKATKRHLYTVTKGLIATFEEYYTLLVEIESILNSRPLTPMSSDPNDMSALSPAHFLVGDTLLLPPERNYQDVSDNKLSRWQHIQKVRQHFWKRWHEEYLHELQQRHKWRTKGKNLEIGTLVLLKEDNVPPLQWVLGRIDEVHPGADNMVRVATVRTPTGLFKRAVKKLCPLPLEEKED